MCGLPGHTPGDLIDVSWDGGEILIDNAETIARPLRLGVDEASALLVALRMLAEMPEFAEVARRAGPGDRQAGAGRGRGRGGGQQPGRGRGGRRAPTRCPAVNEALRRGRRLSLRYYVPGRDEVTPREVDPMRLVVVDGRSYLEGWCYRAEAVRLFRLDRMLDVEVLDVAADPPADAEPIDVAQGVFRPSPTDELVELELTPAGRWVAEYYPCEEVAELGEGRHAGRAAGPRPGLAGTAGAAPGRHRPGGLAGLAGRERSASRRRRHWRVTSRCPDVRRELRMSP